MVIDRKLGEETPERIEVLAEGRESSSEHVHGPACEWARRTGEAECIDGYAYAPAGREATC